TGKRKRGKSTLLNALLGQVVSPVREAIPTTGSVALFHHAPTFSATIRCFSPAELATFENSLKTDPKDMLLRRSLERIKQNFAVSGLRPGQSRTLDTLEELCEALRADGPYSGIIAQVDIGLPQMPLGTGTFLVDTPGLNATDMLLADLALDAGIAADCIIFVMDARDSASGSELTLLRRLVTMGRGITVIGVLTHSDLIRDPAVLQAAREQTRLMLQEACRHAGQVHVAGVVALNARQAMIDRCLRSKPATPETIGEFATLLSMLREARTLDSDISRREGKIRSTFLRLKKDMDLALAEHSRIATSRMPGQELLAMLNAHAAQLAEATRLSMEQARQTIEVAQADLDAWEGEIERSLKRFQETLTLRLMDAVNQTIANSGKNFAKSDIWRKFDTQEAQAIARQCVDEFLEEQRELLQEKEHRFQLFASEINACTKTCLATAAATLAGLEGASMMSGDSSDATHFLIQTRHYMKKLALVSGGAVLGRMSAVGPIALVISVGNMLALSISSPMIAVVVAAVAGTASVLYHLGREDKRRTMLLEKRRKEAESYASRIADALKNELVTAHAHIRDLYAAEISNGYTPALESLFHQATHLRLFIDTMNDIRIHATKQEREGKKQLEELAMQLLPGSADAPTRLDGQP
ncbi:MAG: dynamin family protein, partial [Desulfovibrionaceae bacterium]|nr:dynamin family protein [Desulfovibrionaceae bacterium]